MKVYEAKGFINPSRVRIALGEKKAIAQVEFVEVNVMQGEHRQPEFVAKNPSASVPVLELDDGTCIAECTAITEYIDHTFPGISLTGETAKERAVIHMMQRCSALGGFPDLKRLHQEETRRTKLARCGRDVFSPCHSRLG